MSLPPKSDTAAGHAAISRRTGLAALATLALSGCSAAGMFSRLSPTAGTHEREDIAYGSDPRQRLDLFLPPEGLAAAGAASTSGSGGAPLVVFFYGGTWTQGDRSYYSFVGRALASAGAVVVVADYRLSPAVRYPEFVRDGAMATRYALDHAAEWGADPARVFVMGHSAGAHIAAMVALDARWLREQGSTPDRLAGWIGMAGPYDFLPITNPDARIAFEWPNTPADSQPLVHASAAAPRTLLVTGRDDDVVKPTRNTEALAERLRSLGVDVTEHLYDRPGHVTLVAALARPLRWIAPVREDIVRFIGLGSQGGSPDKAPR